MSKFTVVDRPENSPCACRLCGAGEYRSWYLDLSYVEDFHGNVYICNQCFREIAYVADYEPAEKRSNDFNKLKEDFERLKDRYGGLVKLYDNLADVGVDLYLLDDFIAKQKGIAKPSASLESKQRRASNANQQDSEQRPLSLSNVRSDEPSRIILGERKPANG